MDLRPLTDTEKKLAKKIQRMAEDELGRRPKLTLCQRIIRTAPPRAPGTTKEEHVAALYLENESILSALSEGNEP